MPLRMHYEDLLQPQSKILREGSESYHCLEERHLHALWYEQKYMLPLKTVEGKKIEVISPGLWNSTKGPDFCKAHLKIDGQDIFGDVEIHLHEEGWKNHKHHEDPYYNKVILHLAYWGDKKAVIRTQNDSMPERVILEKQTTLPPHQLTEKLDLDLYPYKEFLGSGKCAETIFSGLPTQDINTFFNSAAHWRLKKKLTSIDKFTNHSQHRFAIGIASVLGYRHNSKHFLELFEYLLPHRNLPENELLSLALGVCGFFEKPPNHWKESYYYNLLHSLWGGLSSKALHQTNLRLDGIRPYNHPIRRLAFLVKMLHHSDIETMEQPLMQLWDWKWKECTMPKVRKKLFQDMLLLLPTFEDNYWNYHFTFESQPQKKYISFLGNETRLQMITNIFLPLLFDRVKKKGNAEELEAFDQFFMALPEIATGKKKYLSHRFFGESGAGKVVWSAAIEQGAYQLHTDFCMYYESSCVGCPFVERMNQLLMNNTSSDNISIIL